MTKRLTLRYSGWLAVLTSGLLAACTSAANQDAPTPFPSPTPEPPQVSVLANCGGPFEHSSSESLTAFFPQNDGYIWTLPDGTDANVTFGDIIATDARASDTTTLSFPIWSRPAVSPDHLHSAMTVQRRLFSSSADTETVIVISDADNPALGLFELPGEGAQSLVTLNWLPESGCLADLHFTPTHEQGLYVLQDNGELVAEFKPKPGRGSVLDATASGWIVLDRLTFEDGEIEMFSVENSGTTIVVGAGEVLPDFPSLPGANLTPEQLVATLREQRSESALN